MRSHETHPLAVTPCHLSQRAQLRPITPLAYHCPCGGHVDPRPPCHLSRLAWPHHLPTASLSPPAHGCVGVHPLPPPPLPAHTTMPLHHPSCHCPCARVRACTPCYQLAQLCSTTPQATSLGQVGKCFPTTTSLPISLVQGPGCCPHVRAVLLPALAPS